MCVRVCVVCVCVCVYMYVCLCVCVTRVVLPTHISSWHFVKSEEAQLPSDGCMVSSYKGASLSSICELTCIVSQHRARKLYVYVYIVENAYVARFLHAGTVWESTLAND